MTVPAGLAFPASRILAGWWKTIFPLEPRQLWVGYLVLHQVEALVHLHEAVPLDAISQFVLRALALAESDSLASLQQRLQLPASLVGQMLRQLAESRLVASASDNWRLTSEGQQALHAGSREQLEQERMTFCFVENEKPSQAPCYLHLERPIPSSSLVALPGHAFEAEVLEHTVRQPIDWKHEHRFPENIAGIVRMDQPAATAEAWQQVIFDRPESCSVLLLLTGDSPGTEKLHGFPLQTEGWILQAREPIFALGTSWRETFPDIAEPPSPEAWMQAWRSWCQSRALPPAEVDACKLAPSGTGIEVSAPPELVERLRTTRSDVFKGEAWLLAGSGRLRSAAQIHLQA